MNTTTRTFPAAPHLYAPVRVSTTTDTYHASIHCYACGTSVQFHTTTPISHGQALSHATTHCGWTTTMHQAVPYPHAYCPACTTTATT